MEPEKHNYLVFLWKHLTTGQRFGIGALLLLLLVFPIAVIVALMPTNPFSRAGSPATPPEGASTILYFSPDTTEEMVTLSPGQTFSVDVMIDTQLNTVTAVNAAIAYADELLEFQDIVLTDYLPTVLETPYHQENMYADEIRFTIGSSAQEPRNGVGKLATITFKVLPIPAEGDGSSGEGSVLYNPSTTEVAAIGADGNVLQFMRDVAFKVVVGPTVTPTPGNTADLNVKFKLNTVNQKASDLEVLTTLEPQNCASCSATTRFINATNDESGTYSLVYDNIGLTPSDNTFNVLIKPVGFLRKLVGTITLVPGTNIMTGDPEQGGLNLVAGDLNGNGEVDIYDFTTVIEDYGLTNSPADFNRNGEVDIYDFTSVVEFYGTRGD